MLPELRLTLGPRARLIDEAAVRFYSDKKTVVEQAEGMYHRLWLDFEPMELNHHWRDEFKPHLRGAFEELGPRAKIWLGDKLGIELNEELLAHADCDVWERQAEQWARTFISSGLVKEAIEALRERDWPQRPSPLYALEADAFKLLGETSRAQETIDSGLEAAERAGDRAAMLLLVSRDAFLHECLDDNTGALGRAWRALDIARELRDDPETLSAGVCCLRQMRKLHENPSVVSAPGHEPRIRSPRRSADERRALHRDMVALATSPSMRAALEDRPALMRKWPPNSAGTFRRSSSPLSSCSGFLLTTRLRWFDTQSVVGLCPSPGGASDDVVSRRRSAAG